MRTRKLGLRLSIGTLPAALAAVALAALLAAAPPPTPARAAVRRPVAPRAAADAQIRTAPGQASAGVPVQPDWTSAGQNVHNTRDAATEHVIGPGNVAGLVPRWVLTTTGNVAATPAVSRGVVYVPDLGGTLWAVNAASGSVIWSASVGSYVGAAFDVSRTTPAVSGNEIVIGTGAESAAVAAPVGAYLVGINASTGALLWRTKVATDPYAMITGSPVIANGVVYSGVSSADELVSVAPTFRGSVVALSARTGQVLWQTYTAPSGYTGNSVWGSTPVVDQATGLLYVATGNNYTVPAGVCQTPVQTGLAARRDGRRHPPRRGAVPVGAGMGRVPGDSGWVSANAAENSTRLGPCRGYGGLWGRCDWRDLASGAGTRLRRRTPVGPQILGYVFRKCCGKHNPITPANALLRRRSDYRSPVAPLP